MQPFVLEIAALVIIVLGIGVGAKRGLLLSLYSLVKFALMVALAVLLYPVVRVIVPQQLEWRAGVAAIAAFVLALVVLGVVAKLLHLVDKIPVLHTLNHIGGALLGGVLAIVVVLVVLIVICYSQQADWCREIYAGVQGSKILTGTIDLLRQAGIPFL